MGHLYLEFACKHLDCVRIAHIYYAEQYVSAVSPGWSGWTPRRMVPRPR